MKQILMIILTIVITLNNGEKYEVPDGVCSMTRGGWFGVPQMTVYAEQCDEREDKVENGYLLVKTNEIRSVYRSQ